MVILHMDNAKPHRSKVKAQKMVKLRTTNAPHPSLSPNIAQSDFYLFDYRNDQLRKREHRNEEALFRTIAEIPCKSHPDILLGVFVEWMRRLEQVFTQTGITYRKRLDEM
jgi:hypothetical protein